MQRLKPGNVTTSSSESGSARGRRDFVVAA
jgi:hypothetical protein